MRDDLQVAVDFNKKSQEASFSQLSKLKSEIEELKKKLTCLETEKHTVEFSDGSCLQGLVFCGDGSQSGVRTIPYSSQFSSLAVLPVVSCEIKNTCTQLNHAVAFLFLKHPSLLQVFAGIDNGWL
ncbi:hypothetical protein POM88_035537 [Heracleum sosnowskyi]|uniref:Uncharacterized protein n=1 Tax=Heracleum sosnowskyi TaxID=360622 RepID=A0AAD8HNP4_9APIA|nr:hypothetical protein POM88_035537 [Heracleum sosnowskyi]